MIEVKMPGKGKDLRIKHFESMGHVPELGLRTDREKITFLAAFTGLNYSQVLQYTPIQIRKMSSLALSAIAKMDLTSKLPDTITLQGQEFYRVDPDKAGIGWHIDYSNCDIKKDPVRLACMFYIPVGYNYSDVDENGNILYPISSRHAMFAEEFPLELFMRSATFFLERSLKSTRRSMVLKTAERRLRQRVSLVAKVLNPFNGKRVSKES